MNAFDASREPAPLAAETIRAALARPIDRPKTSPLYRLGLFLVALAMVLLPLVYVSIVALAGYAVYFHATRNVALLQPSDRHRGGSWIVLLVYVGPLVIGAIVLVFMLKPLFARAPRRAKPTSLAPQEHPLLFALVEQLCATLRAPFPTRIDVDCQVNASASFRRGLLSFLGNDLVLTIGMPLAAGLTLRQLAGVLAHELGHFAQGTGMRVSYVIRSINLWFARVVYERDAWDERLEAWSKRIDIRISIVLWIARLFVWLTRRILWALMWTGHFLCMFLLRQMEFDADQYEVQIAGSQTFHQTARKLPLLTAAFQRSIVELEESWAQKRLADDLPELVLKLYERMPEEVRRSILSEQMKAKGSAFDTHPPDQRRIDRALNAHVPGIFALEHPASALFSDFPALTRRVTLQFYRHALEEDVSAASLVPTAELVHQAFEREEDFQRLERFFQGYFTPMQPPFPPDEAARPAEDPAAATAELRTLRAQASRLIPAHRPHVAELGAIRSRGAVLDRVDAILRAEMKFNPKDFGLSKADAGTVAEERRRNLLRREELGRAVAPVVETLTRRMALGLRLRRAARAAAATDDAAALLSALSSLREVFPAVLQLQGEFVAAQILFDNFSANSEHAPLLAEIARVSRAWHPQLRSLRERLQEALYPFPHAGGRVSLADYAVGALPAQEDVPAVVRGVKNATDRLTALYIRLMGRLASFAEEAEQELGLPPLEAAAAAPETARGNQM